MDFQQILSWDWQGINRSGYQEFPLQTPIAPITTAAIYRQSLDGPSAEAELSMMETKREVDW